LTNFSLTILSLKERKGNRAFAPKEVGNLTQKPTPHQIRGRARLLPSRKKAAIGNWQLVERQTVGQPSNKRGNDADCAIKLLTTTDKSAKLAINLSSFEHLESRKEARWQF